MSLPNARICSLSPKRSPVWFNELHNRARNYYVNRLQQANLYEQQRILIDYIYLHHDNPVLKPYFSFYSGLESSLLTDVMYNSDIPTLLEIVNRYEGAEAAELAQYWLSHQPKNVMVFRDATQQPVGILAIVALQELGADEIKKDPALVAAWNYLQKNGGLRPGEIAGYFRFWMSSEEYQAFSPAQSLIFVNMVRYYLTTPGLAFTFFPSAEPDLWEFLLGYAYIDRLREADFEVGGKRYGVFGHNWRANPPMDWLNLLAERETDNMPAAAPPPKRQESPIIVLSEEAFATAVRDALRDFTRLDALRANTLLQSRLVLEKAGQQSGIAERSRALRNLLKEANEMLEASPRESKLSRVLRHTYFNPALTQEQAAEILDLPFSTYRRYLKNGVGRISEIFWRWELQGFGGT